MRALLLVLAATAVAALAMPALALAGPVPASSAASFRDSIGVQTHVAYFDTAYGDWTGVVQKLDELGVGHLRDGAYVTSNAGWNDRYRQDVEAAAAHGMKFDLGMGNPHWGAGSLDQLIALADGPLANAVDALEAPNEYDIFQGGTSWPSELRDYDQRLYSAAKADPVLRSLPVYGPSLVLGDSAAKLGSQSDALDMGNIHPYTGGEAPSQQRIRDAFSEFGSVWGSKPVVATEAGFHNAMSATQGQPPTPEDVAASYLLRTYLEHFRAGLRRTYAYELIDEKPDPGLTDPEQHFGLLRNDLSEKPAFVALKNLLADIGHPDAITTRPLDYTLGGDTSGVQQLLLQKTDTTYTLALWQSASQWNTATRQKIAVPDRAVDLTLPAGADITVARPAQTAGATSLGTHDRVALTVPADPILVDLTFRSSPTSSTGPTAPTAPARPTGATRPAKCPSQTPPARLALRRGGTRAFVTSVSSPTRPVPVTLCATLGGRARLELRRVGGAARGMPRVLALRRIRVVAGRPVTASLRLPRSARKLRASAIGHVVLEVRFSPRGSRGHILLRGRLRFAGRVHHWLHAVHGSVVAH